MRILLIGAHGTIGSAAAAALRGRGHDVLSAGATRGDIRLDLGDPESIGAAYAAAGDLDAVVCAAGVTTFKPFDAITYEEFTGSLVNKALGQIEVVRRGLSAVSPTGSFTLTSGILSAVSVPSGAAASAANGALEAFVQAVAPEIAPRRVNAISPTVLSESAVKYDAVFAGFEPVPAERVARAFVRAIEGQETGLVHRVG